MSKEEFVQKYTEAVQAKAREYVKNALSYVKEFMPKDEYDEAYADFYNTFMSGANAVREVMLSLHNENKEEEQ